MVWSRSRRRQSFAPARILTGLITLIANHPTDLLAVRFATSPVWETVLAVRSYRHESGSVRQRPWRQAVAATAAQLDLEPLLALNPRSGYVPDFLAPPPSAAAPRFRDQLAEIRRTPLDQIEQELARSHATLADPDDRARVERLLEDPGTALAELANLIEQAWRALVAPYWPRIRGLLSADIAYRSRQLAEHGLRRVVDQLDQRVRWTGSAVTIDVGEDLTVGLDQRGIVLMPSAYVWPGITAITDRPWQPTIVYPARGIVRLWQSPARSARTLARLLGGTRATILASLDAPASTTSLAARLDLSPSGASRHLTALRDAGLLTTTRHGHELRYSRTRLGTVLVRANAPGRGTAEDGSPFGS
jgi:DNA-binding transcriptional ArsR family regulator